MHPLKHMTLGGERESTPYWPMILYARNMVRRGQSYAVDSKRSIDLKTQFVAHVSIKYSILPRPSFINKWFCRVLDISLSWGESRNLLRIHQWFCMLEIWSEEDRAMLSIQSVQLTWKLNLSPICWSGTLFCRGLLLSTNDFVMVRTFLWVGEKAANPLCIHQWFCMLEGWSEEDRAMLLIQSSIDLKTQFVAHILIRYSVLPRPHFINQWFCHGLEVSSSWGESKNPLHIHQWFCMLEGWSEEDRAMLLIQSVQLTWKLNLLPTCWSGTPFCWGLLLSTNDFTVVWTFLQVGERAGIYSIFTNDFVC